MIKCLTVELTVDEKEIYKIVEKYREEHDVVEVVRCKDCKHGNIKGGMIYCEFYLTDRDRNFYCAYGETKEVSE